MINWCIQVEGVEHRHVQHGRTACGLAVGWHDVYTEGHEQYGAAEHCAACHEVEPVEEVADEDRG